jgi:predicted ATPase
VLCGKNGSGKSSVIQALLLLREGWKNLPFRYLNLKTDPASIGTAQDALYQFSDVDKISFVIKNDLNATHELHFEITDFTKTIIPNIKRK